MDNLFSDTATNIRVFTGLEQEVDPFEHNVETTMLNPTPIKAIVTDISPGSVQWKMPGVLSKKAKQIITKKIYRGLLELSQKITIKGSDDVYEGYRFNGKMSIIEEGNYIRTYIYIKEV